MEIKGTWNNIAAVLLNKWKDEKQRGRLLLLIGLLGLLLITFSGFTEQETEAELPSLSRAAENDAYVRTMEEKLERLVETISGAGRCHVMVTLEQGTQYIFASESKKALDEIQSRDGEDSSKVQQKDNSESRIVVLEEKGISRPLVETSREPRVQGVVVVCEGGSSSIVEQRITEVLTTVLGIGSNQVCVVPRK